MSIDTDIVSGSVVANDAGPQMFQMVVAPNFGGANCNGRLRGPAAMPDLEFGWSHERDIILRSTVHFDKFWASSVMKAISLTTAYAWEVRGEKAEVVREAQEMFLAANTSGYDRKGVAWGAGWNTFLSQHLRSYLLTGNGAFVNVIYKGARVVGFVHLDPYRCMRTGDTEYPVEYTDSYGEVHELACHEVLMVTPFPTESEFENGCGMCAAERAYDEIRIHAVTQQKYWERLAGRSADTLHLIKGMTQTQINNVIQGAENEADAKNYTVYMGHILSGIMGDGDLTHVPIQLAGVEPDYDRRSDYELARNRYALALDIDPQDLAPLDSSSYGAASQSRVLDRKAGRTILGGWDEDFMEQASRLLMDSGTRFHFSSTRDMGDERSRAETLNTVANAVSKLTQNMILTPDQALQVGVDHDALPDEFLVREGNTHGPHVLSRHDRSTLLEESRPPVRDLPYNVATPNLAGEDGIDFTEDSGNVRGDGSVVDEPSSGTAASGEAGGSESSSRRNGVLARLRRFAGRGES